MARLLTIALLAVPLVGALLLAASARLSAQRTPPRSLRLAAGLTIGLTLALGVAALPETGEGATLAFQTPFVQEPVGFALAPSSLYALIATAAAALAAVAAARRTAQRQPLLWAATLLALGGANGAFLSDHFLARYVGLEIVALMVALAPVCHGEGKGFDARRVRDTYLLLRLGDAGLLTAILILGRQAGTLSIAPALAAAEMLTRGALLSAALGLALAVWVKLGGWPFHTWPLSGQGLHLPGSAWLYATLMPNLGAYLLYRITPLLTLQETARTLLLWAGPLAAIASTALALRQREARSALVHLGAAQAGWLVCLAAAGAKPAILMGLLALSPIRLLLFIGAEWSASADGAPTAPARRRRSSGSFALGGLALMALGLLNVWWIRQRAAPPLVGLGLEISIGMLAIWSGQTVSRLWPRRRTPDADSGAAGRPWPRPAALWPTLGLLSISVLIGSIVLGPLAQHLSRALDMPLHAPASPMSLLAPRTAVALSAAALIAWLSTRSARRHFPSALPAPEADDPGPLFRIAGWLSAKLDAGALKRATDQALETAVAFADALHGALEEATFDRIIDLTTQGVRFAGRTLQRWHGGRLRWNLIWLPITLALTTCILLIWRW